MISLNKEQQRAYDRFIKARDHISSVNFYLSDDEDEVLPDVIPASDVMRTVDVAGMNHPLFEQNDAYLEYKEAFAQWLKVEPRFRDDERMRASRGDYGHEDSWDEPHERMSDLVKLIKTGGK